MNRISLWAVAVALSISAGAEARISPLPIAATDRDLRGSGPWMTDGKTQRVIQQWSLNVRRGKDNSLKGRITIDGSPLIETGKVDGRVFDDAVLGTISDNRGNHVATFQGTISPTGLSGTYTDRTGETGEWSWNGTFDQ